MMATSAHSTHDQTLSAETVMQTVLVNPKEYELQRQIR